MITAYIPEYGDTVYSKMLTIKIKSKVTTDIAHKNVHDRYQEKSDKTLKNVHDQDQEESDKTLKNVQADPHGGKGQLHHGSALFMLRICSNVSKNLNNFHSLSNNIFCHVVFRILADMINVSIVNEYFSFRQFYT